MICCCECEMLPMSVNLAATLKKVRAVVLEDEALPEKRKIITFTWAVNLAYIKMDSVPLHPPTVG